MEIVEGVNLHLLKTDKFKTNHLTIRFSGELAAKSVAKRALVAQMLETANEVFPTAKQFRAALAHLYGATLSTSVSSKGLTHIVDIDVIFIRDAFTLQRESLLEEVITFIKGVLFSPLLKVAQYQPKVFELEKKNLISYLQADNEDSFYYSHLALKKLFYHQLDLQVSNEADADLVDKETAFTAYQEFHKMIMEDQIDIYLVGEFDDYRVVQLFHTYPFEARKKSLQFQYEQPYHNVVQEVTESKPANQSVLEVAYHHPVSFADENYYALIVLSGLLGSFAHSKLFSRLREQEGLAYHLGCRFDSFTGLFEIYVGISKEDKTKALQLIIKELNDIKLGRFSIDMLNKTKRMIINEALQTDDYYKNLIDISYIRDYIDKDYALSTWVNKVDKVKKLDLILLAKQMRLQAIYFLKGI
ncbi:EF-P 5-aminopentanol modification-associated protein YfmF [Streptococcus halichoeri]|uniref:EF-P 5-aminopentanol modification-associated protein YfmF n=1 Tax=Streptococcus halichoeri TaxID=254785 RepID=UPI0013574C66|nr:pitrilysin family protein [Streptococcus halichoeri]